MATATIKSITLSGRVPASDISVFDKFEEKASAIAKLGANKCNDLKEVVSCSDVILLAVKPQDYESLLLNIKDCCDDI